MSLPKELLDAVRQDKEMLAKKIDELKTTLDDVLNLAANNVDTNNNDDIVEAVEDLNDTVKNQDTPEVQVTAFDAIIKQGEIAEEELKIQETVKEIQTNLDKSRRSLTQEQILATEEQITLLKSGKLDTLEAKKEARELAEQTKDALERIAENQSDLVKEFKSGFSEFRGKGIGGLIRMIVVGIPALLAGITVGIIGEVKKLTGFLSGFNNIFGKTAKFLNRMIRQAAILFSRKGFIGKFFIGIAKSFSALSKGTGFFAKIIGGIGKLIQPLATFAKSAFAAGKLISKLAGPIGIVIAIITGLIGGIKGAIKGFKEDGIIGMFREGLIGIVDGLVGGLVKMIGSLIGGLFKLLGFDKLGETIKGGFSDFVDGVLGALRGTFNMVIGLFTLDFALLKEGIGQMLDGIINGVMGVIRGIGGIIAGVFMVLLNAIRGAFTILLKALKAIIIDFPIKSIEFGAKIYKAIFFDLPVKVFQTIFDGIKFMFMELPSMLIEKVKGFFSSMVETIGDAFSGAFGFVKKIGAASKAALKAALPGGESPKEAFMRVMGADTGGGEAEPEASDVKQLDDARVRDLEARNNLENFEESAGSFQMVDDPDGMVDEKIKVYDDPEEQKRFKILNKEANNAAFDLQQERIRQSEEQVSVADEKKERKLKIDSEENAQDNLVAESKKDTALAQVNAEKAERLRNVSTPVESIIPTVVSQPEPVSQFESRIASTIIEMDAAEDAQILAESQRIKGESATRMAESGRELTNTAQPIRRRGILDKLPISQGATGFLSRISDVVLGPDIMGRAGKVLRSRNPVEEGKRLFERSQNRVDRFGDLTPGQMLRRVMDSPGSTTGANLTSSQIENNQLTRQLTGGSPTSVIAPNTVNNSRSSVTNTTIAAPPHIDKTQSLFGMTNLGW